MSATIERIDEYFRELELAVTGYAVDGKAAQAAEAAIRANYVAALRDVRMYHRWFIQLRDGEGGWAEETARLRDELETAKAGHEMSAESVVRLRHDLVELQASWEVINRAREAERAGRKQAERELEVLRDRYTVLAGNYLRDCKVCEDEVAHLHFVEKPRHEHGPYCEHPQPYDDQFEMEAE